MKNLIALAAAWSVAWAWAGQISYDTSSGVKDLAQGVAWIGGQVPGEGDVAVLSGTGGDFTIGSPVEWQGLVYSNLTSTVTLRAANGATLTLGEKGVSTGGPVKPNGALALYVPVVLACDQEWCTLDNERGPIAIYGGVTGKGGTKYKLTLRNYAGVAESLYGIRSTIDADLGAHGTTMNLQDAAGKVTGAVDTGWRHALYVLNADKGETAFASLFGARSIVNDGRISFGVKFGSDDVRADILFAAGDRIVGAETLDSTTAPDETDSLTGGIRQYLGTFHMTGGVISNNVFALRAGDYLQEGGDVWLRYGLNDYNGGTALGRRFLVNGEQAVLNASAIRLGSANGEAMQNWMIVSNGAVTARSVIRLTDETNGAGANTLLSLAGGTVAAGGIMVGNPNATGVSTNAVARLEVTGGELAVGANGISVATNVWNRDQADDAQIASWYRMRFAGGRLRATASSESTAALVFEGDREIAVDPGVQMVHRGRLSGPASLTKTGAGTLVLPPTCAWTGATTVAAGTLVVGMDRPKTPYVVFRADDLALADGAAVESWKAHASDGFHVNEFTKGTTSAVGIGACPTFRGNCINGHAAVAFNGTNQGLAMTGGTAGTANTAPLNDATNFTVAVAFRATSGAGGSGAGQAALNAAGIAGQYFQAGNSRWLMGMASDGVVVGGVVAGAASGAGTPCSLWSNAGGKIDEKVHVAIFNWTAKGKLRVGVDGTWTESDDTSGMTKVSPNRFLLGVQENYANARTFKYFGGEIAEVRIYRNDNLTVDEIDAAGLEMATTYGAAYELAGHAASAPAAAGVPTSVPQATGVWCADDLTQTAGEAVTVWKDSTANAGEFNTTVGKAILGDTTAPTIASETMNGHKAVAFDGVKNMLGLTGGKGGTYIGDGANFTVALVLRPKNAGGAMRGPWTTCKGVMGQAFRDDGNTQNKWGIGVSGGDLHVPGEQMVMGIRDGSSGTIAHHGTPRDMLDGRAHVVICTFGNDLTMNVDGTRATRRGVTAAARTAARTTLGRIENIGGYNGGHFRGDIAEIRFFAGTALSVAEQNALGRELALKYGIDAGGFFAADEGAFLSPRLTVNAGATLVGSGNGLRLADGATVDGAGAVRGRLVIGRDGVLGGSADYADATVAFEAGAVVKPVATGAGGRPVAVGRAVWPVNGGVTVDLSALGTAQGTVLTWTDGDAPDVSQWRTAGGKGRLVTGADGRSVKVSSPGLAVIIR